MWSEQVPFELRKALFEATLPLCRDLLDRMDELDGVAFMLWDDLLGFRFDPEEGDPAVTANDERVRAVIVSVLRAQVALGGPRSVRAALHGAYHVNHPAADDMVRRLITRNANATELVEYAERVLRRQAM